MQLLYSRPESIPSAMLRWAVSGILLLLCAQGCSKATTLPHVQDLAQAGTSVVESASYQPSQGQRKGDEGEPVESVHCVWVPVA